MRIYYRALIKSLSGEMKNHWIHRNVKRFVESATERAQTEFSDERNIAVEKFDILTKKLNNRASIIQDVNLKMLESSGPLPKNIIKWWQWYHQLSGLDAIESAQQKIDDLQNKVFEYQNKKSALNKEMIDITSKLRELSSQLMYTKRDDPKNVFLTKQEYANLQEQNKIMEHLALLDIEEKSNFIQLTTAYKEYQDNQILYKQKYKYMSIITSLIAGVISIISIIFGSTKIKNLEKTANETQQKTELSLDAIATKLSNIQKTLNSYETKFLRNITDIDKKPEIGVNEGTSNIFITSVKSTAYVVVSGVNYIKKGVYAGGSYIANIFY